MVRSKRKTDVLSNVLIYIVVILVAAICFAPLLNTLALSFSDKSAAAGNEVYLWPVKFNLASYSTLLSDNQFWRSFMISVLRVILGSAINMGCAISMAYPLSKSSKEFRARNVYMWLMIFSMLFSGGTIPLYISLKNYHMLNTIWSLVLPGAVPVFNTILLMNFFRSVPKSLEEAAIIDGAGAWKVLLKIYLPVSVPALATIGLFSIVWHWNEFFSGLIYINTPVNYPLQTYIQQLSADISTLNITDPEELKRLSEISNRTLNSAKIVVSTIPLLLIYPKLQKYFVSGIVMGSVKE